MSAQGSLIKSMVVLLCLFVGLTWAQDIFKVTAPTANIRSGPGKAYSVVTSVKQGDEFVVITSSGDWVKVRTPDGDEGWINQNLGTIQRIQPKVVVENPPTVYREVRPPAPGSSGLKKGIGVIMNYRYIGIEDESATEILLAGMFDIGVNPNFSVIPTLGIWTISAYGDEVSNIVLGGSALYKIPSQTSITWLLGGGLALHMIDTGIFGRQTYFGIHPIVGLEVKVSPQTSLIGNLMYFIVFTEGESLSFSLPGLGLVYYF